MRPHGIVIALDILVQQALEMAGVERDEVVE
jgi:hypothetical protein